MSTWKRPLKRALITTPVSASTRRHCGPLCISQFIYRALANAGIENRSPFSSLSIISIWIQSRGKPAVLRSLCLSKLDAMAKPATGFSHSASTIALISSTVMVWSLLSPQTANTNLVQAKTESILEIIIHPIPDLDALTVSLPDSGDYLEASYSPGLRESGGLAGIHWIQQQDDDAYTLQLLSSASLQGLQGFCSTHQLCQQSAYYQTQVDDKALFRLLFGQFATYQEAQTALQQLPPELKKLSPWARRFGQIKPEILS